MSKLKLLLLGGIFILVGIFNFSNAENLSLSCNNGSCTPGTISFSQGDIINSYNDGTNGECNITVNGSFSITDNDGNEYSCTTIILNNGRIECNGSNYPTLPYTITSNSNLNFDNYNCQNDKTPNPTFSYTPIPSGGGNEGEGGELGQVLPGGFSSLTPAITGIQDTTIQLIPLVVYIGIGILLVILGFIAIRWLVGWLVVKINNYFSSKRG